MPLNMPKIHLKLITGEEFTVSNTFHREYTIFNRVKPSRPFKDRRDAEVAATLLMRSYESITVDQGVTVSVDKISTHWISD